MYSLCRESGKDRGVPSEGAAGINVGVVGVVCVGVGIGMLSDGALLPVLPSLPSRLSPLWEVGIITQTSLIEYERERGMPVSESSSVSSTLSSSASEATPFNACTGMCRGMCRGKGIGRDIGRDKVEAVDAVEDRDRPIPLSLSLVKAWVCIDAFSFKTCDREEADGEQEETITAGVAGTSAATVASTACDEKGDAANACSGEERCTDDNGDEGGEGGDGEVGSGDDGASES